MKPAEAEAVPNLAIDPFDKVFLGDPYAYHDMIREAGPVVWLDSVGAFAMARYEEVKDSLRDHETFCSSRGVGTLDFAKETPFRPPSLLLEADPPLHDRTRSMMNRIVSLKALKELRPRWQAKAEELVDRLVERRRFDAVKDLSEIFPMMIFPDTIGLRDDGREHLLDYATIVFNAFGPDNDVLREGNEGKEAAIEWVAEACKRDNLKEGGWGMAVFEAADRGECTHEEAERLVRSFLSAGVDTTVNGIGHMVLALAGHPEEYQKLRSNPSLVRRAFEESLRWDSTVQTFFRTTTKRVEVGGAEIPEGQKVLLFLAAANRDPLHWDEPDAFRIERNTSGHVGFGFGIHQCLGQMVARLEGELIGTAIAERVASIRLTGAPVRRLNNTLHAIDSVPVEVEPA
ncbi:MAG TPA: cytochrome P450 [Erythrobacter sp.]|mgnify:FL=1|jgi:cytochrome P450|uniref:Cytochrome P450 n=2 Tax=Qipengyuania citrea TaxID=225971 RepID=A0A6I4UB09_9SPHN|nr:cytochrome P450 [Qipengyuania citrea]RZP19764.1 MAG: cytochrome P450 [Erythrobacter sp.]KNH02537.1 cytochrome p450 [Qipengyuania citrea LAMA 915]MDQ0564845.1 cytochrome P450 [Qipengyuania citrea]MXP36130.1 cytochrome P450 [Qipengyuania citrea]HAL89314.1 cytochrome P450 [Erythrobacter sp.]|tara:strand:+ start:452 stop:1654 length:1203 start_codon:yes stop_codon:yes gene_type:complete